MSKVLIAGWERAGLRYHSRRSDGLLVFNIQGTPPHYERLALRDGAVIENFPPGFLPVYESVVGESNFHYPSHYPEGSEYFRQVADFLAQRLELSAVKAVDYLEYDYLILISYFLEKNSLLYNKLLILDNEAEILLHETINQGLMGIALDTFFIYKKNLIFIRNKQEIINYHLKVNTL
ncbi:MAG: hypothetical protein HC880_10525 [Bacteroidia bacterium]|nr:hypothetical protein [Bacteroidia bacterium]